MGSANFARIDRQERKERKERILNSIRAGKDIVMFGTYVACYCLSGWRTLGIALAVSFVLHLTYYMGRAVERVLNAD